MVAMMRKCGEKNKQSQKQGTGIAPGGQLGLFLLEGLEGLAGGGSVLGLGRGQLCFKVVLHGAALFREALVRLVHGLLGTG